MCSMIKLKTQGECVNFIESQGMVRFEVSPFHFLMHKITYCLKHMIHELF